MLENVKDDPVYWIFLYLLLVEERMLSGYKNYNNNDKFFGNKILLLQRCFETSYRAWNLELKMMISWLWWCCNGSQFLDTQVSLAPTHVSWLVGWLVGLSVGWSVTLSDFQSLVSNGRTNQKVKKTKSIYFRILLLEGTSPPTKMYMKA